MPHGRRLGPLYVVLPALGGASAALLVPGVSGAATAGATLLAVGALAILAGHAWGLFVVLPSHLTLVGRMWPSVNHLHDHHISSLGTGAIAVVLVTALPALALSAILMPRITRHFMGRYAPRRQAAIVGVTALALAAAIVLPALAS